jgi:hypothetical protein
VEAFKHVFDKTSEFPCGHAGRQRSKAESLLSECWRELGGVQGGMVAYKMLGRVEKVEWNSP